MSTKNKRPPLEAVTHKKNRVLLCKPYSQNNKDNCNVNGAIRIGLIRAAERAKGLSYDGVNPSLIRSILLTDIRDLSQKSKTRGIRL